MSSLGENLIVLVSAASHSNTGRLILLYLIKNVVYQTKLTKVGKYSEICKEYSENCFCLFVFYLFLIIYFFFFFYLKCRVDLAHLVLYHLSLCCKRKYFDFDHEILSFTNENWESLLLGAVLIFPCLSTMMK